MENCINWCIDCMEKLKRPILGFTAISTASISQTMSDMIGAWNKSQNYDQIWAKMQNKLPKKSILNENLYTIFQSMLSRLGMRMWQECIGEPFFEQCGSVNPSSLEVPYGLSFFELFDPNGYVGIYITGYRTIGNLSLFLITTQYRKQPPLQLHILFHWN